MVSDLLYDNHSKNFCCAFLSLSSLSTVCGLMICGCKSFLLVGSTVFVLQPMSLCVGDPSVLEIREFRYSSRARYGSLLNDFLDQVLGYLDSFPCHAIRLRVMWSCCLVLDAVFL